MPIDPNEPVYCMLFKFNLEITLFIHNQSYDFKSILLRSKIKNIFQSIYVDDLKNSLYFTLSKTKSEQIEEI